MSPGAQRIAISRARGIDVLGWRFFWRDNAKDIWHESPTYIDKERVEEAANKELRWGSEIGVIEEFEAPAMCENYLSDLNAMHEAEEEMFGKCPEFLLSDWEWHLRNITQRDAREGSGLYERLARATAAQRAEAFLKTMNLWTQ